jgi:tRNA threonylcarbamoyl adenosine modification protein YeaZ/ribosomal-protein-alanine acetyltransferase
MTTLLALDTATPHVGVAVARDGVVVATRSGAQQESSRLLVPWVEAVLAEAGARLGELDGVVALGGPGSFTGLRVGLATALGFRQALRLPATAIPTLQALAAAAPPGHRALVVAPALPGEWFAQPWETTWPPRALAEPRRVPTADLAALPGDLVVTADGWDLAAASSATGRPAHLATAVAEVAARLASLHPPPWDESLLSRPLYLAPAPATLPGAPKRVVPAAAPLLRHLRPADAARLAKLESECFPAPWNEAQLAAELAQPGTVGLLATSDGAALGYALWRVVLDEAELLRLAVVPASRRRGIGAALLARGDDLLRRRGAAAVFLEVRSDNTTAIALYERAGWIRSGTRPGYYGDGAAAALYRRTL